MQKKPKSDSLKVDLSEVETKSSTEGNPATYPTLPTENPDDSDDFEVVVPMKTSIAPVPPKKARGRPKKPVDTAQSSPNLLELIPKRPRGRPKKMASVDTISPAGPL